MAEEKKDYKFYVKIDRSLDRGYIHKGSCSSCDYPESTSKLQKGVWLGSGFKTYEDAMQAFYNSGINKLYTCTLCYPERLRYNFTNYPSWSFDEMGISSSKYRRCVGPQIGDKKDDKAFGTPFEKSKVTVKTNLSCVAGYDEDFYTAIAFIGLKNNSVHDTGTLRIDFGYKDVSGNDKQIIDTLYHGPLYPADEVDTFGLRNGTEQVAIHSTEGSMSINKAGGYYSKDFNPTIGNFFGVKDYPQGNADFVLKGFKFPVKNCDYLPYVEISELTQEKEWRSVWESLVGAPYYFIDRERFKNEFKSMDYTLDCGKVLVDENGYLYLLNIKNKKRYEIFDEEGQRLKGNPFNFHLRQKENSFSPLVRGKIKYFEVESDRQKTPVSLPTKANDGIGVYTKYADKKLTLEKLKEYFDLFPEDFNAEARKVIEDDKKQKEEKLKREKEEKQRRIEQENERRRLADQKIKLEKEEKRKRAEEKEKAAKERRRKKAKRERLISLVLWALFGLEMLACLYYRFFVYKDTVKNVIISFVYGVGIYYLIKFILKKNHKYIDYTIYSLFLKFGLMTAYTLLFFM